MSFCTRIWLCRPVQTLYRQTAYCVKRGEGGCATAAWQDSPLVNWLREHPLKGGAVYSNGPDTLYLLTQQSSWLLPQARIKDGLAGFVHKCAAAPRYVVWFNTLYHPTLYDLPELLSCCRTEKVVSLEDGCVYRCLGPEGAQIWAVYRFWSPKTGRHFYTADKLKRDALQNDPYSPWWYESTPFYAFMECQPGTRPVYHLRSERLGAHFYTTDEVEKDRFLRCSPEGWTYEDTAFYVYPDPSAEGLLPVYRLWSAQCGEYLYTPSEREKDKLLKADSGKWIDQGVAWYARRPS